MYCMSKTKVATMTEGNIRSQIYRFAVPVFVSSIFSELYNITNSLIVGNFVSLKALSAVSASTWICNIFDYTFYGLGMGAGILVAKYFGADDKKNLKKTLDSSIVFAVVGGILLTVLAELILPLMMKLCNIGPDIYDLSMSYLRVYILGNSAVLTSQMCFYILRSFGDTRHQLYYSIVSSIANVLLGIILVRVFDLDVIGTAIATILSQFLMDILALNLMFNYDGIDFDIHNLDFSFEVIKDICRLGIPAGFQNMLIAFSSMLVQSFINTFPNEVISGIGVAEKISSWGQLISCAVASATMALVAQNIGAERFDRVRESIKESAILSSVYTTVVIAIMYAAAPWLISCFNKDPGVIYYGTQMLRNSAFGLFFIGFSHVYNAACRGAGNVKYPMLIAIFSQVICKYLFVRIGLGIAHDVRVLYYGTAFGYSVAGILATLYYYTSKWTKEHSIR